MTPLLTPESRHNRNLRLWVAQRLKRGDSEAMVPFHRTLEWLRSAWTTLPGVQQQLAADQLATLVEVVRRAGAGPHPQIEFAKHPETLVNPPTGQGTVTECTELEKSH